MATWRSIQGFPNYSVADLGRIRNDHTGYILSPHTAHNGMPYVSLRKPRDLTTYQRSLALVVARAFIPQPSEVFDTPINLDGDRWYCAVENLMWRPRWFAVRYNKQFTQTLDLRPIRGPVREVDTGEEFLNTFVAAQRFGLLEWDLVQAIENNTLTWPTYQKFEYIY